MEKIEDIGDGIPVTGSGILKWTLFTGLPWTRTKLLSLSARNAILPQPIAVQLRRSSFSAHDVSSVIKERSSIKALYRDSEIWAELIKGRASDNKIYSNRRFIPQRKRMTDTVQPANIPLS